MVPWIPETDEVARRCAVRIRAVTNLTDQASRLTHLTLKVFVRIQPLGVEPHEFLIPSAVKPPNCPRPEEGRV